MCLMCLGVGNGFFDRVNIYNKYCRALAELHPAYFGVHPSLSVAEKLASGSSFNLSKHIQRIRESIETDPELAVGSTKEML